MLFMSKNDRCEVSTVNSSKLHPSVREFKEFVNKHPKLRADIRNNEYPLQQYYEKWALLGEDDPFWDQYKNAANDDKNSIDSDGRQIELFSQIISVAKNMDLNKLNKHMGQISAAIQTVQHLLGQYGQSQMDGSLNEKSNPLFHIFRD